jgi:hypothetical protein
MNISLLEPISTHRIHYLVQLAPHFAKGEVFLGALGVVISL